MGDERNISFFRPCRRPAAIAPQRWSWSASRRCCLHAPCRLPRVPLTPVPAFIASYQSALAINDLITAVLLFSQFAPAPVAGAVAACERLPVHRGRSHRPRPDLSRPVRSDRTFRCGAADDSLALHDLARRISASGARLCAAEGQGWRPQNQRVGRPGAVRQRHRRRRYAVRRDLDRDRPARHPADAAERRTGTYTPV